MDYVTDGYYGHEPGYGGGGDPDPDLDPLSYNSRPPYHGYDYQYEPQQYFR